MKQKQTEMKNNISEKNILDGIKSRLDETGLNQQFGRQCRNKYPIREANRKNNLKAGR